MATLNFSRSQSNDIQIFEDRLFNAILDITRSDDFNVAFTGTIVMKIYDKRNGKLIQTLTSGSEITVSEPDSKTSRFTFGVVFTALAQRAYSYLLYDDTNKVGISHGDLIVL